MDIKPLQLFLTLAETLHYGQCSQRCHVSPSTLSRTIQQLEADVGTALFLRDNRSVELTPAGRRFQAYARETIDQWAAVKLALQDGAAELEGELSVYCSVTASYSFLYQILHTFRSAQPKVEIKLHTGDPENGLNRVQNGFEDIAMAARPPRLPEGVAFRLVGTTPLVLIAPKDFEVDNTQTPQNQITPEALLTNALPMILPETGVARSIINDWLYHEKLSPNIYAQVAGNEAIVSMVSLGFGFGIVPKIVLDNSLLISQVTALGTLDALSQQPIPPYKVGLVAQSKRLAHPIIQAFWQQVVPSHEDEDID